MSTPLSFTSKVTLSPKQENEQFSQAPAINSYFALTNGSGEGQGNAMWHQEVTVVNDSSQTLDLTSLPVNAFNISDTLFFWKIRTFYVCNTSTTTSVEIFAADAENDPWDAIYTVPVTLGPGGTLLAMDRVGWLVGGTSKTIKLVNAVTAEGFVGDTVEDSRVIGGISDTSALEVGMIVVGTGVPTGARITSKTASTVTLSVAATAAGTDTAFDAAHPDPVLVVSLAGVLD
ncbi:hypothetical protein EBS80_04640 [bacterium]|nr:hypothetical protein [bacterium]